MSYISDLNEYFGITEGENWNNFKDTLRANAKVYKDMRGEGHSRGSLIKGTIKDIAKDAVTYGTRGAVASAKSAWNSDTRKNTQQGVWNKVKHGWNYATNPLYREATHRHRFNQWKNKKYQAQMDRESKIQNYMRQMGIVE